MTTLAPTPAPLAQPRPRAEVAARRVIATLEELLLRQVESALARAGLRSGRVYLYAAGQHTWWLLRASAALRALAIGAIVDDAATPGVSIDGVPVLRPDEAARLGRPDAVILSTDTWQAVLAERSRAVFGAAVPAVDLYAGLPPGPYWRGSPLVTRATQRPLVEPSELCIRRTALRLAPFLRERGLVRVHFIGDHWRTFAAASALMSEGFAPVLDPRRADAAVVCDRAIERGPLTNICPGLRGPMLTLWRDPRPWLQRVRADGSPSESRPVRALLRLQCDPDHARAALASLPARLRAVNPETRVIVAAPATLADLALSVSAVDEIVTPDRAGACDLDYTITSPPSGAPTGEWLAIQAELPPFENGADAS